MRNSLSSSVPHPPQSLDQSNVRRLNEVRHVPCTSPLSFNSSKIGKCVANPSTSKTAQCRCCIFKRDNETPQNLPSSLESSPTGPCHEMDNPRYFSSGQARKIPISALALPRALSRSSSAPRSCTSSKRKCVSLSL